MVQRTREWSTGSASAGTSQACTATDASPDGLMVFDRAGRIVHANPAAGSLFGTPLQSMLGHTLHDVPWTALRRDGRPMPDGERPFYRVWTSGKPVRDARIAVRRPDGGLVVLSINGDPLFDQEGAFDGAVTTIRDVTARHRTDEMIRQVSAGVSSSTGEDFFRRLVENVADVLNFSYAFVGELLDDRTIRTLAVRSFGVLAENVTYDLTGTPCEHVVLEGTRSHAADVQSLFPTDRFLVDLGAQSYAGTCLYDSGGNRIGLLGVLNGTTLDAEALEQAELVLEVFASRAAAELERRRVESARHDSEARFRALVEESPLGVAITRGGKYVYVNAAHRRLYRIAPDKDVTASSILDHVAADARNDVGGRNTRRERDEPGESEYETLALREDGTTFPVHVRATRIRLSDGPATIAFLTDVTERKRAEQSIRDREARFRRMSEANLFGVTIFDASGAITWANNAFLRMIGYTRQELEEGDLRWDTLTPPEFAHLDRAGLEQLLATGVCPAFEKEYFRKDGSRVPILIGAAILEDAAREGVCFVVDLSERKHAEAMLRESEQKFRALTEKSPAGIWEISTDRKSLYVNPAIVRMLEAESAEEIVAQPFERFFTPDSLEIMRREHVRRLQGETTQYQVRMLGLRGAVRDVLVSGAPLFDYRGNVRGMMGTFTDVTELTVLREQLIQSQKMEAVGVLAGGVAHDFNNLLAVISGYGESLVRRLGAEHPLAGHAQEIHRAAERGGALVKQLLTFSRRQRVEFQRVDLTGVVQGLHDLLHRVISHDVKIETPELEPGLQVQADPGQLEQVVMNLALNARDAMPQGGTLTLHTRRLELDEAAAALRQLPPGKYAKLSVIDTGVGMDEETQRRVFEPFFTTKGIKGTGLGLSIVYSIAEQSRGRVMVESAPGKGTRFDVILPAV